MRFLFFFWNNNWKMLDWTAISLSFIRKSINSMLNQFHEKATTMLYYMHCYVYFHLSHMNLSLYVAEVMRRHCLEWIYLINILNKFSSFFFLQLYLKWKNKHENICSYRYKYNHFFTLHFKIQTLNFYTVNSAPTRHEVNLFVQTWIQLHEG